MDKLISEEAVLETIATWVKSSEPYDRKGWYLYDRVKAIPSVEPCDKCVYSTKDGYCQYDDITETIPPFEPCEDAISREAVLEKAVYTETEEGWYGYTVDVDYIKSLPSVKPQEPNRDMEEIVEVINCDADAEIKLKMISNIAHSKPHYFKTSEPRYCDRNICLKNEYNGIGCDECEVTRSQEPTCDTCKYNTAAFNPCNACKNKSEYEPQNVVKRKAGTSRENYEPIYNCENWIP